MILGIGVDSVEIYRFSEWHTYSKKKLQRIFSQEEIEYCLQQKNKSAERFAVRFAVKEAFFKAFSIAFPDVCVPFLTMCTNTLVCKKGTKPFLHIVWNNIKIHDEGRFICHISLTHTQSAATAFIIIEKTLLH